MYQQSDTHVSAPQPLQLAGSQTLAAAENEFQGSEPMDFDDSLMLAFNQASSEQLQAVTQRSGHGTPASPTDRSTLAPSRDTLRNETDRMTEEPGVGIVLDPLAAYCSSVIRREAEVAAVATAVADYISWTRNIPSTGAPPVTNPVFQQMLQNIEIRVRELVEIAHKGHDVPLGNLLQTLRGASGSAMAARVDALEEDLQKQARDQTSFFKTEYDACKFLSEQTQKRP